MAYQLGAGTLDDDRSDGPVGVRSPVPAAGLSCIQPIPQTSRTQVVESDAAIAFDQFGTTLRKLIDRIVQRPPVVPAWSRPQVRMNLPIPLMPPGFNPGRDTGNQYSKGLWKFPQEDILRPVESPTRRDDDLDLPGKSIKGIPQVARLAEVALPDAEIGVKHPIKIKKDQFLHHHWTASEAPISDLYLFGVVLHEIKLGLIKASSLLRA
jgi:hypothetical protein